MTRAEILKDQWVIDHYGDFYHPNYLNPETGVVWYDYWYCSLNKWERHVWDVLAWCPLSEIEPYKEKDETSRLK